MRRSVCWATTALILSLACGLAAGDAPASARPSAESSSLAPESGAEPTEGGFVIESIGVVGTGRASVRRVVQEQLGLELGQAYTEAELRKAIERVRRLPFVLDAQPSLHRGSTRGRYELVVEIEEVSPIVAEAQGELETSKGHRYGNGQIRLQQWIGVRTLAWLEGSGLGASTDTISDGTGGQATLGLRRYGLLGPRNFADLRVGLGGSSWVDRPDPSYSGVDTAFFTMPEDNATRAGAIELSYSAALTPRQSLLALARWDWGTKTITYRSSETPAPGTVGPGKRDLERLGFALVWTYDGTDDPFAATRGTRAYAGTWYLTRSPAWFWFKTGDEWQPFAEDWPRLRPVLGVASYLPASRHVSLVGRLGFTSRPGESEGDAVLDVGLRWVHRSQRNRARAFVDMTFGVPAYPQSLDWVAVPRNPGTGDGRGWRGDGPPWAMGLLAGVRTSKLAVNLAFRWRLR